MEGLAGLILISLVISIASVVFVIWVMYTVAKSLKEIAYQLARIASMISLQKFTTARKVIAHRKDPCSTAFTA